MGSTGKNKKLNKYILLEKEKKYEIFTLLPLWYAAALRSIRMPIELWVKLIQN